MATQSVDSQKRDRPTTVPCPTCGKSVAWVTTSKWRPFCSDRCRLIDLGDWLSENHRIPEPLEHYPLDDESD